MLKYLSTASALQLITVGGRDPHERRGHSESRARRSASAAFAECLLHPRCSPPPASRLSPGTAPTPHLPSTRREASAEADSAEEPSQRRRAEQDEMRSDGLTMHSEYTTHCDSCRDLLHSTLARSALARSGLLQILSPLSSPLHHPWPIV